MGKFSHSHTHAASGLSGAALSFPTQDLYWGALGGSDYWALSAGKITTWGGLGSSGLYATQGTGALQPVPGTGIGGRDTAVFAGGQILSIAGFALGVFDCYVVCKIGTDAGERIVVEHSANGYASGNGHFLATRASGATLTRGAIASNRVPTGAAYLATGAACLLRHAHNGTHATHVLERDGANIAASATFAGNPGTSVVTDNFYIGARTGVVAPFVGEIAAILIYNSAPSAPRAAQILAWSQAYYGTP